MLPAFFDLRLRKWDVLENEAIELFVRLRTSSLSFPFMSQAEFTALEKFLINREVPLLFKCNLLLLRQVLSVLLLFIKIILLPLHKFSSFLLVSLILFSKSWSLQWILQGNAIFMLSSVLCSLIEEITFLIFEEYLHCSGHHLFHYEQSSNLFLFGTVSRT